MSETVAIAADHGGFELKSILVPELRTLGFSVLDLGTTNGDAVDYPDMAERLTAAMREGRSLSVESVSASGAPFADSYSLKGAASAIDAAALGCLKG